MNLLLLGGPKFVGRAVIDAALASGHELTLFNRGTTGADLYPELERIVGDRDGGLEGLLGRRWDAVIDTSGYVPRIVGASANLLATAVEHYVFVSSISVYASFDEVVDETSPLDTLSEPGSEEVGEHYGALKALSEHAVEQGRAGAAERGLKIDFVRDDVLNSQLRAGFDLILDRGCYHVFAPELRGHYAQMVARLLAPTGTFFLKCFSEEQPGEIGPYQTSPEEVRKVFGEHFEVQAIERTVYQGTLPVLPRALFCTLRGKGAPQG